MHQNGFPFYLHQQTGAISWTRPYKLLQDEPPSAHEVPVYPFSLLMYTNIALNHEERERWRKAKQPAKDPSLIEGVPKGTRLQLPPLQHQASADLQQPTSQQTNENPQEALPSSATPHTIEKALFRLLGRVVRNKRQIGKLLGDDWWSGTYPPSQLL